MVYALLLYVMSVEKSKIELSKGGSTMKRGLLFLVLFLFFAGTLFSNENIVIEKEMVGTANRMEFQKAPFDLEVYYVGNNLPTPFVDPENLPWSTAVNVNVGNSDPDRNVHIAHGSDGSVWVSYDSGTSHYQAGIAKSDDDGQTWDVRNYGHGSYEFQYSAIDINDAGYLHLWTTITGGSYSNDICWLQSQDGSPNDIDALDGWYIFTSGTPDHHDPEGVAALGTDYHSGLEVVCWTNKEPDSGTDVDSVEIWWTDFGQDSGYSYVTYGSDDDYNQSRATVALCVPGDTFRMIAFEEDSSSGYFNVNFWRIDSVGASVWMHGWETYHFEDTRNPSLAAEGDYAYVSYELYDGSQWDVLFGSSSDAGDSWGTFDYIANNGSDDERHPRLTSDSARVGATYTYDGTNITNRFIYSDEAGMSGSWSTEEIITDGTTTEDSIHCVDVMWYAGNDCWYAVWTDTRSGGTDVYTAFRQAGTAQIITDPAALPSSEYLYYDYTSKRLNSLSYITKYCERVYNPILSEGLARDIESAGENELIGVYIVMKEQVALDYLLAVSETMPRKEKSKFVLRETNKLTDETQVDILNYLREMESVGKAARIHSIFVVNSITAKATKEVILELSRREDVGWLMPEVPCVSADDVHGEVDEVEDEPRAVSSHIGAINADDVWNDGFYGQGIICAVIDGGANYNHNDLSDHLWDGDGNYPNGGYDFVDSDFTPYSVGDPHGSHVSGIVCGDGTSGETTGVAPECSLMILRTNTNLDMYDAINFAIAGGMLAHGYGVNADIIQSSVGFEYAQFGTDAQYQSMRNSFRPYMVTALSSGIIFTYAAGNGNSYGGGHYSVPYDLTIAADCPPPWLHPDQTITGGVSAVMAVGACNNSRARQSWSSYGPTEWDNGSYSDYPYNTMLSMHGLLKPDIMAPGLNLRSIHHTSNSSYSSGNSGTSFAAPCLAGACALLLSKDGSLTPARLDSILEVNTLPVTTSDPSGKDSLNGSGFLDVYQASLGIGTARNGILKVINTSASTANLLINDIVAGKPWIVNISPTSFSVAPGDTKYVDVWADTSVTFSFSPGLNYDTLKITSNSETDVTTLVEVRLNFPGGTAIEFTNLEANGYVGKIDLTWRTASEFGIEAWQVVRSEEAEGDYTLVGVLQGQGTTNVPHDYLFTDSEVEGGRRYYYKLVSIDNMAQTTYGPVSAVAKVGPSVSVFKLQTNPARYGDIRFSVFEKSRVSIKIYNITGRLIKTLVNGVLEPNTYSIRWDGTDDGGRSTGSGVYFIKMDAAGERSTLKLTLLK
jgi:subtilisin family serine protease